LKEEVKCPEKYVDCSKHGGYDLKDQCKQTCTCVRRFVDCSKLGGYDKNDKCNHTCKKKEVEPKMCTLKFKDCSKLGGYDPKDQCKQTCIEKEEGSMNKCFSECKTTTENTKHVSDLSKKTFYF